ncbi:hypothetical protein B0H10DRAFT_2000038 [Mycena sp. CBHHK59/15]|nr:hypothetical protein B0H10DRAFT_2000038 [Mycena sp. CBHHK59/15]
MRLAHVWVKLYRRVSCCISMFRVLNRTEASDKGNITVRDCPSSLRSADFFAPSPVCRIRPFFDRTVPSSVERWYFRLTGRHTVRGGTDTAV